MSNPFFVAAKKLLRNNSIKGQASEPAIATTARGLVDKNGNLVMEADALTDAPVTPTSATIFTNKSLVCGSTLFIDGTDATKTLAVQTSGATTGKKTTLVFAPTNNRTITFPDASDTVVVLAAAQTLSGKTFSDAVLTTGSGGVGYATGAGGAVTQATNRTTGVTLNKTSGAITLVSAAGSTTPASFNVTNNCVAATDTIHLSQKAGTDKYILLVTNVATNQFTITAYTTGGTTTEQPVINFNVIKGVAA